MFVNSASIKKGILALSFIAFLAIGTLGFGLGMDRGTDGRMSPCPFMGMSKEAVCQMTPFEHMAAWQSTFTSLPLKGISVLALLLLIIVAVFFIKKLWDSKELELVSLYRQRFRDRTFIIRSPLQEAFSQGILNPKLF